MLTCVFQLRQDATLGSRIPTFLTNSTTFDPSVPLRNMSLLWEDLPLNGGGWDGFSLLIDDVEKFRGVATNFSLALLDQSLPHFFRLAVSSSVLCRLRITLTSISSRKTVVWEIIPRRHRSSRTALGLTLRPARHTSLIFLSMDSYLFHFWAVLQKQRPSKLNLRNIVLDGGVRVKLEQKNFHQKYERKKHSTRVM